MDRIFGYFFEFWIFGRIVSVESVYVSLDIFRVMSYRKREPDLFFKACCTVKALCTWIRVQNNYVCQVEAQD